MAEGIKANKVIGIIKRVDTNQILFKQEFDIMNDIDNNISEGTFRSSTIITDLAGTYKAALNASSPTPEIKILGIVEKYNAADQIITAPNVVYNS